jgi:NDP-sugar pyrophosphorylase family protein
MKLPIAVLAGGLATRLRPLTANLPKSLIPVAGKPFLEHQLALLKSHGLEHVVLCAGHLGEMIQQVFADGSQFGIKMEYSFDGAVALGTGGALKRALPLLGDEFFVMYGDSYLPIDYAAVADFFRHSGRLGCMTVFENANRYDRSNVVFAGGEVKVYDKTKRIPEMRYIDYGLSLFRAESFESFPSDRAFDLADVMQTLLNKGQLAGYEVRERFYEAGSFSGLAELEKYLKVSGSSDDLQ